MIRFIIKNIFLFNLAIWVCRFNIQRFMYIQIFVISSIF